MTSQLTAALRATAEGIYPDEAGTGLIVSHGAFLTRCSYSCQAVLPGRQPGHAADGWGRILGVELSGHWLERYRQGEHEVVWHELRQLGSAVREPGRFEEARLVCDEMARRARHNVEVIIRRLESAGYRFHGNDHEQAPVTPHVPPTPAAVELAGWLEDRFEFVPMTLLSWLRLVGDVWLVGTHPHWAASSAGDPLVIELEGARYPGAPMQRYFEGELEVWREQAEAGQMFVLPLAPDRIMKNNVSGGPPYGVIVPDSCADGLFVGETTMPFVSYLNWVFRNGGFPWPTAPDNQWQLKRTLAKDLLPL